MPRLRRLLQLFDLCIITVLFFLEEKRVLSIMSSKFLMNFLITVEVGFENLSANQSNKNIRPVKFTSVYT